MLHQFLMARIRRLVLRRRTTPNSSIVPYLHKNIKLQKKGVIKFRGKYVYEMQNCEDTLPNIDWCIKHNLTPDSHPSCWFDAFIPIKKKRQYFTQVVSVSQLTTWTNTKAAIYNAGDGGLQYPSFEAFLVEDILQHIGV